MASVLSRRVSCFLLAVCLLPCLLVHGEEPKPTAPGKPDNNKTPVPKETLDAIRESIVERSSFDVESFSKIAASDVPPSLKDFPSHPLSLVLCFFLQSNHADEMTKDLRQDMDFGDFLPPPPAAFAKNLYALPDLRLTAVTRTGIKELTCELKDDQASGIAKIRFSDIFTANVQYQARLIDGKWQATEFSLPKWDVKIVRQPNQKWLATGMGVEGLPVRLPFLRQGLPSRDSAAPRLRVNIGFNPEGGEADVKAQKLVVFVNQKMIPLADFQKSLPQTIKEFTQQKQTTAKKTAMLLWADRKVAWGPLEKFLYAAHAAGIEDFRFAAEGQTAEKWDSDTHAGHGEFRVLIPKPEINDPDFEVAFPMPIDVQADANGKITSISMKGRKFGEQEAPAEVKRMAEILKHPLVTIAVEIQASPHLHYGNLLNVLSAFGELQAGTEPESKTYVSHFKPFQLPEPKKE